MSVFGVSLLTPQRQESMKAQKPLVPSSQNGTIITLRLTAEQNARLLEQAQLAGLNRSKYIRQKLFGGRPLVAKTDAKLLGELRRFGGMLKHQCQLFREQGSTIVLAQLEHLFGELGDLIARIGDAYDSQKDKD